jgi:hypothetical protein
MSEPAPGDELWVPLHVSLQAPCHIFVEPLARIGQPISHFLGSVLLVDFIYLTCHAALLPLMFITFRVLGSITSYDRSKSLIEMSKFDRSKL